MTQVLDPADTDVKDFSAPPRKVTFNIDHSETAGGGPDRFDGVQDLPALLLVEFVGTLDQINDTDMAQQPDLFKSIFELVLAEDSATRFIARMGDKNDPISLTQIMDIMPWVMEQYGMRPTQPSSDSSSGSESQDGGTNSTDSAPLPVSTSELSTPSVS